MALHYSPPPDKGKWLTSRLPNKKRTPWSMHLTYDRPRKADKLDLKSFTSRIYNPQQNWQHDISQYRQLYSVS